MPLASFKAQRKKIEFPGGDVEVRAISLQDVAIIIDSHQMTVDRVASMIRSRMDLDFENQQIVVDTIMEAIRESPLLVANLIALCADETEFQEAASQIPLPAQVEILQAIADITFKDEAALKKFLADVTKLIRGMIPTAMNAAA
jgi:hypothetical protein